jgi:tetratricopeptide (TPR) repeat protein
MRHKPYTSAFGRGLLASALAFTAHAAYPGAAHAAPPASGAQGGKPDPAKKQRAEQHLRAGTAAFDRQEYDLAITELKASYAEIPNPSLLYALGQAYRMSGDCAQAVEAYRAFIDSNPTEKQREAATSNIDRCEKSAPSSAALGAAAAVPESARTNEIPPEEPASQKVESVPPADTPPADTKAWYEDVPGGILTGTGIAAAAVGTVLYIGGRSKVSDADAAGSDVEFARNRDDADAGLTQQKIGLVVLGAGGALITAGIIRYVSVGGQSNSAHVRIGPTWGGVMATGAF